MARRESGTGKWRQKEVGMNGWVSINRRLLDELVQSYPWKLWESVRSTVVFLLAGANYEDSQVPTERERIHLRRGQIAVGRFATSRRLGIKESRYLTIMNHLERDGFLTRRSTNRYTVVTIVDYDSYCPAGEDTIAQIDTAVAPT